MLKADSLVGRHDLAARGHMAAGWTLAHGLQVGHT